MMPLAAARLATSRAGWAEVPMWQLAQRVSEPGYEDLPLLSVYRDWGVVPRKGRSDNNNNASDDLSNYQRVMPGDLVLNKMKTWQGSLGVSSHEGIVSPAYIVCRIKSDTIHPPYLHHLLRSAAYIATYGALSKGIRPQQWDLPWEEFRTIPVPLPPVLVQRQIADFLDDQVALIDRAIELCLLRAELLEEWRSGGFGEALYAVAGVQVHGLNPEEGDSTHMPLSKVLRQLTNGFVGPTRDLLVEDGVPYLQSLHIKRGVIDFQRRPYYVPAEWLIGRQRIVLGHGDLLLVQTGALGEVALVTDEFVGASCHALLIARAKPSLIRPRYLWHLLRSGWGKSALLREETGALHPHLEAGKVRDISIPVPSLDDQAEMEIRLDAREAETQRLVALIQREQQLLQERRKALITAAVTGEFDVTTARVIA